MLNIKFLRLPATYSYPSSIRHPIPLQQIQFHLGPTLYSRISSIYTNTIQAIANLNYSYLSATMSSPLSQYIINKRNDLKDKGYRVRIHRPNKTIVPFKNNKRDTIWKGQNVSIQLQSNVYFGMEFDQSNPLNDGKTIKIFKTGKHRYFVYNISLSPFQNLSNLFKDQTYQFKTKIISSTHMKIFDLSNKSVYLDDQKDQFEQRGLENTEKQVQTEILMRTGNLKFDWVLVDINGIMANRSKV